MAGPEVEVIDSPRPEATGTEKIVIFNSFASYDCQLK